MASEQVEHIKNKIQTICKEFVFDSKARSEYARLELEIYNYLKKYYLKRKKLRVVNSIEAYAISDSCAEVKINLTENEGEEPIIMTVIIN